MSVIGGADGPTAIYLSGGIPLWLILLVVGVLILGIVFVIFFAVRK